MYSACSATDVWWYIEYEVSEGMSWHYQSVPWLLSLENFVVAEQPGMSFGSYAVSKVLLAQGSDLEVSLREVHVD